MLTKHSKQFFVPAVKGVGDIRNHQFQKVCLTFEERICIRWLWNYSMEGGDRAMPLTKTS